MLGLLIRALFLGGLLAIAACGGGGGSSTSPPPPGPPPPPPPPPMAPTVTTAQVFQQVSFSQPVALKQAPGDATRWYVVEQGGVIQVFTTSDPAGSLATFIDISSIADSSFSESGLLGMAFHPGWPNTPEVFLSYTRTGSGQGNPLTSYVSRFLSMNGGMTLDPTTEQVILTVSQDNSNHNGGDLAFGQDGFLYMSFGDGGGAGDPNNNAQTTTNLLGTIVRVDVDGGTPYAIPPTNPFSGNGMCANGSGADDCPEIFAWGLRNPWRMGFDSSTGMLWAGDVGQGDWEEVDRVVAGDNYGWNEREGAHCYPPGSTCSMNSTAVARRLFTTMR